jgi:CheY-like chemotaxis protein
MDIQMPVLDGLTATTRIRKMEKHKNLPIIAVSAHTMSEDRAKSLAHGMNDHVAKPINPEVLAMTLQKWLESAS